MASGAKHDGSVKLYWVFAVILCVITFFEWYIFRYKEHHDISNFVLVASLLTLSIVKFIMVVGWYMHLRFDPTLLKQIFIFALLGMTGIGIGLAFLMT